MELITVHRTPDVICKLDIVFSFDKTSSVLFTFTNNLKMVYALFSCYVLIFRIHSLRFTLLLDGQ